MVFAMRSWLPRLDSDSDSRGQKLMLELKLRVNSRLTDRIKRRAMRVLSLSHLGVDTFCFDGKEGTFTLVGHINPVEAVFELRKICVIDIVSVAILSARNDNFRTTERITELILIEDADLEMKRSSGIRICEEQQEQAEKQQEDHPPPGQADACIFTEEASPLSRRLPLSPPLASEARRSSSAVSHPYQRRSDQMQAAPDQAPAFSSPVAPPSSHIFGTESLAGVPAQSSNSGGACLPKDMKIMEEEGQRGHDQLYKSVVHHLHSGIDAIRELKRHYDLHAGEQASHLKEMEDTTLRLRKQVEELEVKLSMANMSERRLVDMLRTSEDRHAMTKMELALMREKMDEAERWIEPLEAAVSRYQNRLVVAEAEKEEAEGRACKASVEEETMSAPRPSPAAPRSTFLSSVPSPSPCLPGLEVFKESALFPELAYCD